MDRLVDQAEAQATRQTDDTTRLTNTLRTYAERVPGHDSTALLDHGRDYQPAPLPAGVRQGRKRRCFENAHALARRRGWTYVEGYAIPPDGSAPHLHAWVTKPGSAEVIDPTWFPVGLAYRGIPISDEFRRQVTGENVDDYPVVPPVGFLHHLIRQPDFPAGAPED